MVKSENNNKEKRFRVILPFAIIIIIIFSIAVSLSWQNITRFFARLGIVPYVEIMVEEKEFTYTINFSETPIPPESVVGYYSFANDTFGNWNMTNCTDPGICPQIVPLRTFTVIYPENITEVQTLNTSDDPITQIKLGRNFKLQTKVKNNREGDVSPLIIHQLKRPNGMVKTLYAQQPLLNPGEETPYTTQYLAEETGFYTLESFVWTDWPPTGVPVAHYENKTIECIE